MPLVIMYCTIIKYDYVVVPPVFIETVLLWEWFVIMTSNEAASVFISREINQQNISTLALALLILFVLSINIYQSTYFEIIGKIKHVALLIGFNQVPKNIEHQRIVG